jgi:hypothetical protein
MGSMNGRYFLSATNEQNPVPAELARPELRYVACAQTESAYLDHETEHRLPRAILICAFK